MLQPGPVFKDEYTVIDEADMLQLIHGTTITVKGRIVHEVCFPDTVVFPLREVRDVHRKEQMLEAMKSSTLSFLDSPVDAQATTGLQLTSDAQVTTDLQLGEDGATECRPASDFQLGGFSGSDAGILPAKTVTSSKTALRGGGTNLDGVPIRRMSTSLRPSDTPPEIWNKLKGKQREVYLASYCASAAIQAILFDAMSFKQSLDQQAIDSVKHSSP